MIGQRLRIHHGKEVQRFSVQDSEFNPNLDRPELNIED